MSYTKRQMEEYQRIENKFMDLFYDYPKIIGGDIRTLLDKLHRSEVTLNRINENECNGWPKPVIEYRDGKKYQYSVENEKWRDINAGELFIMQPRKSMAQYFVSTRSGVMQLVARGFVVTKINEFAGVQVQ